MYLTVKQQVKHLSKTDYKVLRELCHTAKNLANQAIYNVRQYYFSEGEYLNYQKNYTLLKNSPNYKLLNSNMSQQIMKEVDGMFQSFFSLRKLAKKGKYPLRACRLPGYYPKNGFATLIIGFVRLKDNKLAIPMSNAFRKHHEAIVINLPPVLYDKKIKEIRIIPKYNARYFEIQYTYECDCVQNNLDKQQALALDFGVNNLVTGVTNNGSSFIIDGRKLKSYNQWFNKEFARLSSVKDKQCYSKKMTRRQQQLSQKHYNRVNDYISKTARYVIDYCLANNIGTLVVGYNETFQRSSHLGKQNNQNFVNIPFGKLRDKLEYLCELYDIVFIKQEESYTSKASFFDNDEIPVYNPDNVKDYAFSGKRIHRGLYKTKSGMLLNADVNGALNILRKSNAVDCKILCSRGEVNTPVRIRVA